MPKINLAAAVKRGVRQAVVLGAGLDTLALRNPHLAVGLKIFEVDHPATQAWKFQCLSEAGFTLHESVTFIAVDFEREPLGQKLSAAGFAADQPAFFIWLGVVPYLRRQAIEATLAEILRCPLAEIVLDYSEPLESYLPERKMEIEAVGSRAAESGEPWISHFDPEDMSKLLNAYGLAEQEDIGWAEIAVRYLGADTQTATPAAGPHVIHARRRASA